MTTERFGIVIVGAGAIGCAIAYHLAKRGHRDVLLIDRSAVGEGSSSRAAGGLRYEFGSEMGVRFSQLSLPWFETAGAEFEHDFGCKKAGYLFLARTTERAEAYRQSGEMQRRLGVRVDMLTPADVAAKFPFLRVDGLVAGTWCPDDIVLDQVEFMRGFDRHLRRLGVAVRAGCAVTALRQVGDRVVGVTTDQGEIEAATVALAAGAWSGPLAATVGVALPLTPLRRELFTVGAVASIPLDIPFIRDLDSERYFRGDPNGYRLSAGSGGLAPLDAPFQPGNGSMVRQALADLAPALAEASLTGGWVGLIENTPDRQPLLGFVSDRPGLYIATGFSGYGLMHAPAAGQLAAEALLDGEAHTLDISSLNPTRFRDGVVDVAAAMTYHEPTRR